jgi:hypothetical protein
VSYPVIVVVREVWSFITGLLKTWGKAYIEATAALITLLVSDNILGFTHSPYYLPETYGAFVIVALIAVISRKKKWGRGYRKMTAQTAAWMLGVISVVLLPFAEKDVYFFDTAHALSNYNLAVLAAALLLILLPTPFILAADLGRDLVSDIQGKRQKRVPTIFNQDYIVPNKNATLFDKIVYVLKNL